MREARQDAVEIFLSSLIMTGLVGTSLLLPNLVTFMSHAWHEYYLQGGNGWILNQFHGRAPWARDDKTDSKISEWHWRWKRDGVVGKTKRLGWTGTQKTGTLSSQELYDVTRITLVLFLSIFIQWYSPVSRRIYSMSSKIQTMLSVSCQCYLVLGPRPNIRSTARFGRMSVQFCWAI